MAIDYTKYPVPRLRHHTNPNFYLPKTEHYENLPYFPPTIEKLEWSDLYADGKAPTALDIGCGLGKFTLEYALQYPYENILGLEVRRPVVDWVAGVIAGETIGNCAVQWYSVVNHLPFIAAESIGRIFYFFPDPWFKKRHHKRRAFTAAFLDECRRILKPEGMLYLMTDVPEVHTYQCSVLDKHSGFTYHSVGSDAEWGLSVQTNQELFCLRKGIPYTRVLCKKRSAVR